MNLLLLYVGGRGSSATEHKHPEKNDFRALSAISANLLY